MAEDYEGHKAILAMESTNPEFYFLSSSGEQSSGIMSYFYFYVPDTQKVLRPYLLNE